MATHSSILAWKILWTEEPAQLPRVGGAGLYVLNADGSPRRIPNQLTVRYGYNGGSGRVSQTKMYFHQSSYEAYSPHRVRVSEDGRIFISSMGTNGHVLWETNPEVFSRPNAADWGSKTGWSRVLSVDNANTYMATEKRNCSHDYCGIYSIYTSDTKTFMAGPNIGFDVQGSGKDLKLLMLSGCKDAIVGGTSHHFYCSEYDLGEAKAWTTVPSREIFRGHVMNYAGAQVQYDKQGNVWMCQDVKNVYHTSLMKFQANGTIAYQDSVNELYRKSGAIRFNHDFTQVAITSQGSGGGGAVTIYPVLENGMPDWANGQEIDTREITYTSIKDMAWDYANNLYLAADGIHGEAGQCIAVYAIPHDADKEVSTPANEQYAFTLTSKPAPATYELTVVVNDPQMGSAEGAGTYEEGATATLTATPNTGHEFLYWTIAGEQFTENPLSLLMNSHLTVEATFRSTVSTAIDNVDDGQLKVEKIWRNGVMYILRNGEVYSVVGARVE